MNRRRGIDPAGNYRPTNMTMSEYQRLLEERLEKYSYLSIRQLIDMACADAKRARAARLRRAFVGVNGAGAGGPSDRPT